MSEYIEREAAIQSIEEVVVAMESWITDYQAQRRGLMTAITIVTDVPAADVAPVRHGRWNRDKDGLVWCCLCGFGQERSEDRSYAYRPNCGAKMDGDA